MEENSLRETKEHNKEAEMTLKDVEDMERIKDERDLKQEEIR